MPKKRESKTAVSPTTFSLGDRVEIIRFGPGKIIELRGPLGPDGALVYRVLYRRKPNAGYIEVLGSQLRHAKVVKRPKAVGDELPPVAGASRGA